MENWTNLVRMLFGPKSINFFFMKNELPNVIKVRQVINDDPDLPNSSRSTLNRILHDLYSKYQKRGMYSMLIDREDIICWRRSYLRTIKAFWDQKQKYIIWTKLGWMLDIPPIKFGSKRQWSHRSRLSFEDYPLVFKTSP